MRIGFTGTQAGMTEAQWNTVYETVDRFILEAGATEFHMGDCVGADRDFFWIVKRIRAEMTTVGHIPDNDSKRAFCAYTIRREPKPYLVRNRDIVDESDVLIATPKENKEQLRSGTWATVRYARKQGKKVVLVNPDGKIV